MWSTVMTVVTTAAITIKGRFIASLLSVASGFPPCRLETHRAENRAGELQLSDFGEQVELVRNRLTVWDGWADQPDPLALWSEERRDQGAQA